MAFATTHAAHTPLFTQVSEYFAAKRAAYADHRLYVQTMTELQSLSTRELNDLGLSRSSLHDTAFNAVYG